MTFSRAHPLAGDENAVLGQPIVSSRSYHHRRSNHHLVVVFHSRIIMHGLHKFIKWNMKSIGF